MIQTIYLSDLLGTQLANISREALNSIDGDIVTNKYNKSFGRVITVDTEAQIATVDIFDENPAEFIKGFRRLVRMKNKSVKGGINWKSTAIKAAQDFGYGDEVIMRVTNAKNDSEVERIMREARKKKKW